MEHSENHNLLPEFLQDIDKKSLEYDVPDGFFDQMQENVLAEIKKTPVQKQGKTVSFWIKIAAAAAMVAIAISISIQSNSTEDQEQLFGQLSDTDMQWYMDNYTEDWSNDDVLAMIENDPLDTYADIIPLTTMTLEETDITEMIEDLDDDILINYEIEE